MTFNREPIAIIGALEVVLISTVTLIGAILEWESALTGGIIGVVSAVIIVIGTLVQRSKVDSPETVAMKVDEALHTPVPPAE